MISGLLCSLYCQSLFFLFQPPWWLRLWLHFYWEAIIWTIRSPTVAGHFGQPWQLQCVIEGCFVCAISLSHFHQTCARVELFLISVFTLNLQTFKMLMALKSDRKNREYLGQKKIQIVCKRMLDSIYTWIVFFVILTGMSEANHCVITLLWWDVMVLSWCSMLSRELAL